MYIGYPALVPKTPSEDNGAGTRDRVILPYRNLRIPDERKYFIWGERSPAECFWAPRVLEKLTRFDPHTLGWGTTTQTKKAYPRDGLVCIVGGQFTVSPSRVPLRVDRFIWACTRAQGGNMI